MKKYIIAVKLKNNVNKNNFNLLVLINNKFSCTLSHFAYLNYYSYSKDDALKIVKKFYNRRNKTNQFFTNIQKINIYSVNKILEEEANKKLMIKNKITLKKFKGLKN